MTTTPAHGNHTHNGTPTGYTTVTPFIVVPDGQIAIDFYTHVFHAEVIDVTRMPTGDGTTVIAHAVLDLGNGRLQLAEPMPAFGTVLPPTDRACYSLAFYCPNVDDVMATALAAGATVREPVSTFVSGDRFGSFTDPAGVRWSVMTRVADLSDAESADRVAQWAAEQGS